MAYELQNPCDYLNKEHCLQMAIGVALLNRLVIKEVVCPDEGSINDVRHKLFINIQ